MPRGYRLAVVAAFGLLTLAAGPPPDESAQAKQARAHHAVDDALTSIAKSQATAAKAADTGEQQKPCGPSGDNYNSDLCAQWKAATAAADSAYWAWASFWVGLVGACGIVVSLLFTYDALRLAREAARDGDQAMLIAERNAKAAVRSIAQAQEHAEIELRAYVFVVEITWENFVLGKQGAVKVTFENTGKTPASDVTFRNEVDIYEVGVDEGFMIAPPREGVSKSPIAPGSRGWGSFYMGRALDEHLLETFAKVKTEFIAFGSIAYVDVFGVQRQSNYRFRAKGGSDVIDFVAAPNGNSYT